MIVRCNYLDDLRGMLAARLEALGFAGDPNEGAEQVLLKHLNVAQRRIEPRQRAVSWSKELSASAPLLSANHRDVIDIIVRASAIGEDLNPYLSRQLARDKDADFVDPLDNDWGIKHMHLGAAEESPGVIKGTRELLFVIVREETLYLLDVGKHGDWAKQRLFDIAVSNWPSLYAHARINGVSGDVLTEKQRLTLRRKSGMATMTADGNVYVAPGGGQVAIGLNWQIRREADFLLNRFEALEEDHRTHGEEIAAQIQRETGRQATELHLRLQEIGADGVITVLEGQTNVSIRCSNP